MKFRFLTLLFLLANLSFAQVTFIVNNLPAGHDFNKSLYISGSFENWTGGNEKYKLTKNGEQYEITLSDIPCNILYKFTLGSWASVEMGEDGASIENRNFSCEDGEKIVYVSIGSWTGDQEDIVKSSAHKNVQILSEEFEMPQLDRKRRVWIYLPPNYENLDKKYPVLYMHDGQNVFDVATSYAGEWEVDEKLNELHYEMGLSMIVVAVDNGQDTRVNEYIPYPFPRIKEHQGEQYAEFLVETLKPYIDQNFRTLADVENTALMGSSLGGLITHYATLKYPDVFGKAGVLSPSFWVSDESYELAEESSHLNNTRMYFLMGEDEGGSMVSDMDKMITLMKDSGFNSKNISSKIVEDGQHNEKLWRENFEEAILWLFDLEKPVREFKNFKKTHFAFEVEVSDGTYHILFYNSKVVEVAFVPEGEKLDLISHAVVMKPEKMKHNISAHGDIFFNGKEVVKKVEENDKIVSLITDGIEIKILKNPFQISYSYKDKLITSERKGYHKTEVGEAISLSLSEDEILYGAGARALGMNRRGNRLQLYNKAHYGYEDRSLLMNYTMPLVVSSNKYMVHFDNAPIGYLDLDSKGDNTLTYETISGRKTYQIIVGDTWEDLIDNYTDLTGKQPLPPRWAFGNFASRFGYHSQEEVENTIKKFKEEEIPLDAVILDIFWFGKDIQGHMGNLEFYRDSFPEPVKMIKNLKDHGIKTTLISEPFVLTTSNRWEETVKEEALALDADGNPYTYDFYFGNTGLIDIYSEKGKSWFWNIYKEIDNMGVDGVWGDLGEPEVHPYDLLHTTGTADEVHNIYGHDWAKLVYEGYAQDFPDKRPFILMRAGYSGSQRFGLIPWSGDVNRTWGGLHPQVEIALQMGIQGLAYMHSDLGGFAGPNLDDELYTRWLQYGVFQPIFRPHAQEEVPSEPVFREAKTMQLAKKSVELRYRMLPYNYDLAFKNNQTGVPFMRPLFYEEDKKELLHNSTTYLWGNDFLVTPIVDAEVKEQSVYFPANSKWFDFYSDESVAGGQELSVTTHEDRIPTYVRAGAFIPLAEFVQTTDDYAFNNFELHYYHDASVATSKREFYNDNGLTKNAFEKGKYEILKFKFEENANAFDVAFEAETGIDYQSETKNVDLIIHNLETKPNQIRVGRKKIKKFEFNTKNKTLKIPLQWHTSETLELKIKFKK